MTGVSMSPLQILKNIFFITLFIFLSQTTWGAKTRYKSEGEVSFEAKTFKDDKNPETDDQKIGLSSKLTAKFKKGRLRGKATLTAKAEEAKAGENFLFLEEAFVMYKKSPWLVKVGFQVFNWS
ncbi:MAG: hypothetical protein VYD54_07880, partial [Bdellovibrionota bacterium]|nr:hypothetical protein [Bdellovibrionota bacterium]